MPAGLPRAGIVHYRLIWPTYPFQTGNKIQNSRLRMELPRDAGKVWFYVFS